MNTAPERAEGDKSKAPPLSRIELDAKIWAAQESGRKKEDYQPSMPPLGAAAYLLDYLYEIGPIMQNGIGGAPLSHEELRAFQRNVGVTLTPWAVRTLRRLSVDYLAESRAATKRDCPPPWKPE